MAPLSGTSVLHDISMEEFKVYDYSDPVGNHTFTAEGTAETVEVENVILEVTKTIRRSLVKS